MGICGARADNAGVACDVDGRVATTDDDKSAGKKIEYVSLLSERRGLGGRSRVRSHQRHSRDEDRVHRVPCQSCLMTRCQRRIGLRPERGRWDVQQTFFCPRWTTDSFIKQKSNARAIWSHNPVGSRFPCGPHASTCIVFLC